MNKVTHYELEEEVSTGMGWFGGQSTRRNELAEVKRLRALVLARRCATFRIVKVTREVLDE